MAITVLSGAQVSPSGEPGPFGAGIPVGSIIDFAGVFEPAGWIFCYGQSLLRTGTYAGLFAVLGTTYGFVDGTHFSAPDLRSHISIGKQDMGGINVAQLSLQLVRTRTGDTVLGATNISNIAGGPVYDICGGMLVSGPGTPNGSFVDYISPGGTGIVINQAFTTTQNGGTFKFGSVDARTLGARGGDAYYVLRRGQLPAHWHTVDGVSTNYAGSNTAYGAGWAITTVGTSHALQGNNEQYYDEAHPNIQPSIVLNKIIKI